MLCASALAAGPALAQQAKPEAKPADKQQAQGQQPDQTEAPKPKLNIQGGGVELIPMTGPPPGARNIKPPKRANVPTKTPEGPVTGAPGIRCPQTVHDFGVNWLGGKLEHVFTIRNEGDQVLKLLSVKPSCGCTVAKGYDKEIPPGGEGKIPVSLSTKKVRNKFSKNITVNSNDPATPSLRLRITGEIKSYVDLTPRTVSMGHVAEDAVITKTAKLANNTKQELSLSLETDKIGPFTAELVEKSPGKEYHIQITATPPYKPKLNRAKFFVMTNLKEQPKVDVPVTLYVPPRLDLRPASLILPPKDPKEQQRMIKFTNNGEKPVKVLSAQINDEKIKLVLTERQTGKSYDVRVIIPPDYEPPTAPRTITLATDDPQQPELTVPVRGRPKPRPKPATKLVGKPAPKAQFTTVGGEVIKTGAETGKVTVLDFYASWCGYCRKQVPMLAALHKEKFADNPNVHFVGINQDALKKEGVDNKRARTSEQISEMWTKTGAQFDYALDTGNLGRSKFRVQSYPTLVLLGKTGNVEAVHFGAKANLTTTLEQQINQLLAGESITRGSPGIGDRPAPLTKAERTSRRAPRFGGSNRFTRETNVVPVPEVVPQLTPPEEKQAVAPAEGRAAGEAKPASSDDKAPPAE